MPKVWAYPACKLSTGRKLSLCYFGNSNQYAISDTPEMRGRGLLLICDSCFTMLEMSQENTEEPESAKDARSPQEGVMSTESVRHTTWRRRAVIGVPLLVGVGILLVACGGGGSASPSSTTQATSTEAALAAAATSAASVPSGWQGRPPKSEVINGITVPPEPAPSINNATLAGVDSNKNGVRDDVERMLAKKTGSQLEFSNAMVVAVTAQAALVLGLNNQSEADAYTLKIACAATRTLPSLEVSEIEQAVFNNTQRQKAIKSATSWYGGRSVNFSVDCK